MDAVAVRKALGKLPEGVSVNDDGDVVYASGEAYEKNLYAHVKALDAAGLAFIESFDTAPANLTHTGSRVRVGEKPARPAKKAE